MSATVVPARSLLQRLDALGCANEIRFRRAQLKRDLKAGRVCVLDIIEDPPEWALTMKVLDLLLAVPMVGQTKALTLLRRNGVSPVKTLGGLSGRQRDALVAAWIWRRR